MRLLLRRRGGTGRCGRRSCLLKLPIQALLCEPPLPPQKLPEPARSREIGGQCPAPLRSPPLSLPARLVVRVPPLSLPARLVVRVPPLCLPSPCLRLSSPCGVRFPGACARGARMRVFPRAWVCLCARAPRCVGVRPCGSLGPGPSFDLGLAPLCVRPSTRSRARVPGKH